SRRSPPRSGRRTPSRPSARSHAPRCPQSVVVAAPSSCLSTVAWCCLPAGLSTDDTRCYTNHSPARHSWGTLFFIMRPNPPPSPLSARRLAREGGVGRLHCSLGVGGLSR